MAKKTHEGEDEIFFADRWRGAMALLSANKYLFLLLLFLTYLPFAGNKGWFLYSVLGNLFHEFGFWGITWVAFAVLLSMWSLMVAQGIVSDGILVDPNTHPPRFLEWFFSVPVHFLQFLFYCLLAVPTIWVMIEHAATSTILCILAIAIGALAAFSVLLCSVLSTRLASPAFRPLVFFHWPSKIRQDAPLTGFFNLLLRIFSSLARGLHLYWIFPGATPEERNANFHKKDSQVQPVHFFSTTVVVLLVLVLGLFYFLYRPGCGWASDLPAVFFLYVLMMLLIWVLAGLQYHLGRFRISPVLGLLVLILISGLTRRPAVYSGLEDEGPPLSAVEVARKTPNKNLVVVSSTGGGILAAGWTTLALDRLINGWDCKGEDTDYAGRADLRKEIRLISGVSGGSVGTAFYLHGLSQHQSLAEIRAKSVAPALGAVAYGFAYYDIPELLLGPLYDVDDDRGWMLEEEWHRIATSRWLEDQVVRENMDFSNFFDHPRMSGFRDGIREGSLPAFILNATAMESGRRVMITPIKKWEEADAANALFGEDQRRGFTLPEYLEGETQTDLSLWTAARLSATFPYISPAARFRGVGQPVKACEDNQPCGYSHSMIDGGYYDNYGVASALDWLNTIMEARLEPNSGLEFEKVAVVQLRASAPDDPLSDSNISSIRAALLGPVFGILNIRSGAAFERNRISVQRFLDRWQAIFRQRGINVRLKNVVFQPAQDYEGPLSWQLSRREVDALEDAWDSASICAKAKDLQGFLASSVAQTAPDEQGIR
ncbi:MAG TPA: patatin-like phospholipase family protein [Acidobacteriota bacterium]|nr:patatin-like phospholipase family protein [Acidobacteriota bacterium]